MIPLIDFFVRNFFSAVTILIIAAAFGIMVGGEGHVRWLATCFCLVLVLSVIAGE